MADIEDFSSLDPLGPEYGRSDLPTMDSKGLSAFEGDELKDPIINFPVVPKIQNLELPQHDVNQYVVHKTPKVQGVPSPKLDFNAFKNAHRNYTLAKMATGADKSTYGKIYSYNAGPDGNAFYDRYAAYGAETFAKVGFSPLRDNEALFNSRTTMWDDHKRMMQNSFWPLFANGFVAGPKSLGKMLTGDFTGTDLAESQAYSDAAAIGQTTKSGWGMGFANNLLMNFAYSAGIITEAIVEEAVAIALAPETMGGSVFLTTANAAKNLSKIGTGFKLAKGVQATTSVTDGLRAVNNTLKSIDNVKDARTFWQSAKAAATSTMSPLKNTFTALGDIGEVVTKGSKSYNLTNLAKIYKTAGGFYKDVRNFNMALSEARLEAGMVENQIYDNGYNQYYDKFGEAPSDKVQKELIRKSKEGSLDTLYWNTALIYVSNSITFNNLLGPKGGVGGFMRNTMKDIHKVGGGKFGDIGKVIYNQGKKVFQFQANTAKGLVKSWASQPIYKSAMGTLGYFKKNFTEGFQENLQEVISGANEKYYSDSFEQSAIRSHEYHKGLSKYNLKSQNQYLKEELKGQFTAQGAETFASGFFMGMLAAPLNAAVPNMMVGYNRMFNKEAYQKFKADKLEITKGIIENLNSIGIKEFLDNKIFNLSTQEAVATIKRTGTKKEAHDADMEGFVKQMSHVLRNGVMDVYLEKLQAEKQFSPEEFEGRVPTIPKGEGAKYLAKIDDVIAKAKKLEKRYKYYTDKHPNPVTAANLPPVNTPEYEDAIALHTAWEDGIEKAIYFNEAFENTMKRKVDIESTYVAEAPLQNMSSRDSSVLFNDKELQNEIGLLKNEVDTLKDLNDPKSQEQYEAKVRKLAVMEKLYSTSTGFKNFFNRYDNAESVRAALQKDKGTEPVTDEEVEAALSSVLGEFTEDNKEKIKTDYEGAYKEYLQEIASVNGDYIFDEKIDKSFGLLVDHIALNHESGRLMKYVNLLHNPQGFLDMVDRNRQWMKDLYKKRGKIYEKMVTEELNMVISNSLLNALANEGVYVSVEAFEEWEENGVPPEEFFDNTRKLIIPKGTDDYEIFYQLFQQASELKNEKTNPLKESLDTELKKTLDTLDEKLEKELELVPKIDSKVVVATIEMENDMPITVNKINTELDINQYAEALVTTEEGGTEWTLFFKDANGILRYNSETGAEVKGETLKETFEKVNIFSMESIADPAYAQPIIDRYTDLKVEAVQDYALNKEKLEEKDTTPTEEFVPITTDMEPDAMPATLYNDLYKLFQEQYIKKLSSEEFVNMTPEEERNVFRTFIQGSKEAKKIIEDFNAEVQLNADAKVTKNTAEKEDFDFLYQGKTINTASIKTIAELRTYEERFKKSLKTLEEVKSPTAEDIAQRMAYQLLIADFEKLITTRSKVGRTPAMQKSIDLVTKLQSMQEGIEQSTLGYMINQQLHERVSNVIAKLESKKYAYKNQGSVNTAFYLTIGLQDSNGKNKNNLTEANIDSFIEELRTRSLAGFSEYTYKKLKENLVNTLSDETNLPNATNQDILDLITTTVSEETYEESRISGNYLDLQVKNLFDGQPVVFNKDNITKKAFDNLFGAKGILTGLKAKVDAGELYIVSQGIRVYDSELNIAGEIDLLMVDSSGQITIVDVKSGLVDKWDGFSDANNANSKLENYQLQQTAYANLLQRMLGVEAKIALLPIQMDREDETGKILKAGKPTKKDLLTSDIFIDLDKGPVQERINSIIPLKEVTSAPIVTPTNTTTDTKADTLLGKVGNTEYEVKADGVYYQGKKLNMPIGLSGQNLFNSNRELIEHHIKQRKEKETLFTKSRNFLKGERFEIQIQSKFGMVGFGVDVSQRAKVLNKDGETVDGYLYNEALSEHFDTIEEAIEYANEVFQGDKEFIEETNAKYDAEIAALEGTSSTTATLEGTTELTNEELNAGPTAGNQTFNKPVSTKEEIKVYVAGPVLKASEIFWDKNIKTTGSWVPSIQDVGGKSGPNNYIEIEYDSLSEENKKIALELTEKGSFRTFDKSNSVRIVIPGNNLSIEEIQRKSIEIANKFKNQDLLWYTPQTLDEAVTVLEEWKKQKPQDEKEYNDEIERVKNTWGQDLYSNQYFDKATNAIWASKELYDKSKGLPVKTTVTDTKADIEKIKQEIIGKTQKLKFANVGDILYSKNGTKYEVLSKKDKYGRSLEYKRNDKEVGTINPKTVSNFENNFAEEYLYYRPYSEIEAELAALEGTETNNTEDGEIIPSETEEITEVYVADSDRVTVAMVKDQLDKANTAQEVQTVIDNLNVSVASEFVLSEDITEMVELINAKKAGLVVPQDMPIISESLEKGTELVAKKNIFTGAKNIVYATQDSILMVTNVDTVNKTVSVKALNSNKTIKIKFSDMNENFGLKTNLMNGTEKPDEPLTSEDKTFVSESIDLTTTFIENKTKIEAIEKAASAKTIQELEDDLLEDIFC
jgi:hypothetical protein